MWVRMSLCMRKGRGEMERGLARVSIVCKRTVRSFCKCHEIAWRNKALRNGNRRLCKAKAVGQKSLKILAEVRSSSCFDSQDDGSEKKRKKISRHILSDDGSDDGSSSQCSMDSVSRQTTLMKEAPKEAVVISSHFAR